MLSRHECKVTSDAPSPPPPNPAPPTFKPSPPSATRSVYKANDVLLILDTGGDTSIKLDRYFNFDTAVCLIYAENVLLSDTITLPGKSLGIFCSSLTLHSTKVTISVDGTPGSNGAAVATGPPNPGVDGHSGGTIWLYVEKMTENLSESVILTADGGQGGSGGATTSADNPTGGAGGNGGEGGNISIFYGSAADSLLRSFPSLVQKPWANQVAKALKELLPECISLNSPSIPPDIVAQWTTTFLSYANLPPAMNSLINALRQLVNASGDPSPTTKTIQIANDCSANLTKILASTSAPPNADTIRTESLNSIVNDVNEWLEDGGDVLEAKIYNELSALTQSTANPWDGNSDLRTCFNGISERLVAIKITLQIGAEYTMNSIQGGHGGSGGVSYTPSYPPGVSGKNGAQGSLSVNNLGFDGSVSDLDVNQVCAFPEQCQMLLNKADRLFFTNDQYDVKDAGILYSRLSRRLAFLPTLDNALNHSNASEDNAPQIKTAYDNIEENWQLTTSATTQLHSIYNQCLGRMNKINLGEDMFGHAPNWTPRLSFDFYAREVNNQMSFLKTLETAIATYKEEMVNNQNSKDTLEGIQQSNLAARAAAQQRIYLIGRPSGILDSANEKIGAFTPLLAKSRKDIKDRMETVEWDIQHTLNLDPQSLLDAFASLCMAPSTSFAAATFLQQGYKAISTVTNNQGVAVNSAYVISELASCGDTLQSLSEAFHYSSDGKVQCDDPSALKIIATADQITSLMNQFKGAIREVDRKALVDAINDYVTNIEQRNNAVIAYNAAIALLQEAVTDYNYYDQQEQQIGTQLLSLNSTLPAIYYWLQQTMNSQRLSIMERLNYEGRAISFWGLTVMPTFAEPGPLQESIDLENNQQILSSTFDSEVTSFAHSPWSVWPQRNDQGVLYQFSALERSSFLKPTQDNDGNNIYGIFITFDHTSSIFLGQANTRLSQIRLWLIGAACKPDSSNRQVIMAEIEHMGKETILPPGGGQPMDFEHDAVVLQFQFNATGLKTIADCTGDRIFSHQEIENDYQYRSGESTMSTNAPIGPFATWRFQTLEAENEGLVMTGVTEIFVEFRGRNMSSL